MTDQPAQFVLKLRQNITLEGDLLLAKMEIEAILANTIKDVLDIRSIVQDFPVLRPLYKNNRLDSNVREQGVQAYWAEAPLSVLPSLIRNTSFIQRIYCITQISNRALHFIDGIDTLLGPVLVCQQWQKHLVIEAIPHYALLEFAQVVGKHSHGVGETKRNLNAMLDALLGKESLYFAQKLAETALSAKATNSPLSHDVHYYKAKFFPRLARSMLNVHALRLGNGPHRAIDNFMGSGTTLLESSVLGIPSLGMDIDPLSVLISKVKLDILHLDSELLSRESERVLQALEIPMNGQLNLFKPSFVAMDEFPPVQFPDWLMKNRKMTQQIADELGKEIRAIQSVIIGCDPQVMDLCRVLLSDAIARKIRMRFLGTGVGRFSLTFAKTSITEMFIRSLRKYVKIVAAVEWLRQTLHIQFAESQVLRGDARQIPIDVGKFDILITSPPYLPASSGRESYAKAHAPSLLALGLATRETIDDLTRQSIGSMNGNKDIDIANLSQQEKDVVMWLHQDKLRAIKAEPTARYFLDMRQSFAEMKRILSPGAYAIVVSGKQSTFYQFSTRKALYTVPSAEILADQAQQVGFVVEALHDVKLVKLNKNARPRSLDDYYETIIVLKKPG